MEKNSNTYINYVIIQIRVLIRIAIFSTFYNVMQINFILHSILNHFLISHNRFFLNSIQNKNVRWANKVEFFNSNVIKVDLCWIKRMLGCDLIYFLPFLPFQIFLNLNWTISRKIEHSWFFFQSIIFKLFFIHFFISFYFFWFFCDEVEDCGVHSWNKVFPSLTVNVCRPRQ